MADGKNSGDEPRQPERPELGPQSEPVRLSVPGEVYCPQCGGLAKRTWSDVSTFVWATFFISLMLTPVISFACMAELGAIAAIVLLLCAGTTLLSFWALPVAGAIAAVARPRCRLCGHLIDEPSDETNGGPPARFPLRFALIGGVFLLVALVIGLVWFRRAPGQETGAVGLTFFLRIIMAGFALGLGFLAQAILWRRLQLRMTSVARRSLLLLPTIVLGIGWLTLTAHDFRVLSRKYDPVKRASGVLDRAGLTALPKSAGEVKVHSWAFMLSGKYTLRFTAEPNDIERFLADSPSLKGITCRTYSSERMLLRRKGYVSVFEERDTHRNEYVTFESDVPRWYQQEIRGPGRRYEINWCDGKYRGELLIDDETHTVYVHVDRC